MKRLIALLFTIVFVACSSETKNESTSIAGRSARQTPKELDGRALFKKHCVACHQADGSGIEKVFPPLKNSDFLMEDPKRAIHNILKGMRGEITVNGVKYNGIMAPLRLKDKEIVAVVNYILRDLNNSDIRITEADVKEIRNQS